MPSVDVLVKSVTRSCLAASLLLTQEMMYAVRIKSRCRDDDKVTSLKSSEDARVSYANECPSADERGHLGERNERGSSNLAIEVLTPRGMVKMSLAFAQQFSEVLKIFVWGRQYQLALQEF